jgi:hypothetical protein
MNETTESENEARGRSISFLGYEFTHDNVRLRKRMKQTFARKVKRIKSKRRRQEVLASYWGWCKHGNCKNLWRTITNNDMSFTQVGIKRSNITKDGKKFFEVEEKKMLEIINVPITVVDFIAGIHTKIGEDRYAILIEMSGIQYKVITNSYKIKDVLQQARKKEGEGTKVFPCQDVIIRRKQLRDNKSDYYFDE